MMGTAINNARYVHCNGWTLKFNCPKSNLYHCNLKAHNGNLLAVDTIHNKEQSYCALDCQRANKARDLQETTGFPNKAQFIKIINFIKNCSITTWDVNFLTEVLNSSRVRDMNSILTNMKQQHALPKCTKKTIGRQYASRGFRVVPPVHADNQFTCLTDDLLLSMEEPITTRCVPPAGQHEPTIERSNRTLKEAVRTVGAGSMGSAREVTTGILLDDANVDANHQSLQYIQAHQQEQQTADNNSSMNLKTTIVDARINRQANKSNCASKNATDNHIPPGTDCSRSGHHAYDRPSSTSDEITDDEDEDDDASDPSYDDDQEMTEHDDEASAGRRWGGGTDGARLTAAAAMPINNETQRNSAINERT
eukprot:jgi/Psemu1/23835/gm1.23835_g